MTFHQVVFMSGGCQSDIHQLVFMSRANVLVEGLSE